MGDDLHPLSDADLYERVLRPGTCRLGDRCDELPDLKLSKDAEVLDRQVVVTSVLGLRFKDVDVSGGWHAAREWACQ